VERDHILRVLEETKWIVAGPTGAAARLGMKRTTLQAKCASLLLDTAPLFESSFARFPLPQLSISASLFNSQTGETSPKCIVGHIFPEA
jgi:Bacterial regulatory protein, Fis family